MICSIPVPKIIIGENGVPSIDFSRGGKPFEIDNRKSLYEKRIAAHKAIREAFLKAKAHSDRFNKDEKATINNAAREWEKTFPKIRKFRNTPHIHQETDTFLQKAQKVLSLLGEKNEVANPNFQH